MSKKSVVFKRIKKLTSINTNNTEDKLDEDILNHLGLSKSLMDDLEQQSYDAAKEDLKILVNYQNNSNNPDLSYKYIDDSGLDIRANISSPIKLSPLKRILVPTGIHFELPESFEVQIRPRSGLASKNGITVLNTPGTIDRGYAGEVKIILINLGEEDFTINHGDRIAQAVVSPVITGRWSKLKKVNNLITTKRSSSGFGSTGIK